MPHLDRALPRYHTRFGSWIQQTGVPHRCHELAQDPSTRVTPEAIYHWLAGVPPRPHRAEALVAMSEGVLTLDAIYAHGRELRQLRGKVASSSATCGDRD